MTWRSITGSDRGRHGDLVELRDAADVVAWLVAREAVNGVYNLGSGVARSFKDLAEAVFHAAGQPAKITYVDTPPAIRDHYQYFTQAEMGRLKAAGYTAELTSLEDGVADYVQTYLVVFALLALAGWLLTRDRQPVAAGLALV